MYSAHVTKFDLIQQIGKNPVRFYDYVLLCKYMACMDIAAYLSIACRSLAGFQVGSNRTTMLAPTKFRPRPPALGGKKQTSEPTVSGPFISNIVVSQLARYSLYSALLLSRAVHYVGNRVPFGGHTSNTIILLCSVKAEL